MTNSRSSSGSREHRNRTSSSTCRAKDIKRRRKDFRNLPFVWAQRDVSRVTLLFPSQPCPRESASTVVAPLIIVLVERELHPNLQAQACCSSRLMKPPSSGTDRTSLELSQLATMAVERGVLFNGTRMVLKAIGKFGWIGTPLSSENFKCRRTLHAKYERSCSLTSGDEQAGSWICEILLCLKKRESRRQSTEPYSRFSSSFTHTRSYVFLTGMTPVCC